VTSPNMERPPFGKREIIDVSKGRWGKEVGGFKVGENFVGNRGPFYKI